MALEEYRRKRDFTKSPEPEGIVRPRGEHSRFFCVQKHLASHLHYDFRLEHNGVLLSWAVPKGPSLDPKTRRLAMHVEDHPLDYGEFEGVIPEGYGAGIVMLWDRGTWTPEVDDVDAALAKGDLKFTLDGYKLKGSWVLVRTSGRYAGARSGSDGRSWLLIKHRDEWSGELDITTFAPQSVKSGGDLEDILASDTPAVWVTNRPAKTGDGGGQLAAVIERAAAIKSARAAARPRRTVTGSSKTAASNASRSRAAAPKKAETKAGTSNPRTAKAPAPAGTPSTKAPRKAKAAASRSRVKAQDTKTPRR